MDHTKLLRHFVLAAICLCVPIAAVQAAEEKSDAAKAETKAQKIVANEKAAELTSEEKKRRRVAIALNYCRASFHRIRTSSNPNVLFQERSKILNNLDLGHIQDQEILNLYTSLLEEINQIDMTGRERQIKKSQYRSNLTRTLATELFVIGTQVATAQVGSAIRSGAKSWWDYRDRELRQNSSELGIERRHIGQLVSRSNKFLNAFWKLSRANKIPDEWLVRSSDLDRLTVALQQQDLHVRLRILKRMDRFMRYYPPWWYHLGRTQQQLGLLTEAAETYKQLDQIGAGFFRQDDMLAAGTTNLALIQHSKGMASAPATARKALAYSNQVWEANLTCAWILAENQKYNAAEDALLANLDVQLEQTRSTQSLVALYQVTNNRQQLARMLRNPRVAALIPPSQMIVAVASLQNVPAAVNQQLNGSIRAMANAQRGHETFTIVAAPNWDLSHANVTIQVGQRLYSQPQIYRTRTETHLRFAKQIGTHGSEFTRQPVLVSMKWPNRPEVRLQMTGTGIQARGPSTMANRRPVWGGNAPAAQFRVSSVGVGQKSRVSLQKSARNTAASG